MKFHREDAHAIYDVLHEVLGAKSYWRDDFVRTLTTEENDIWREYRLSFWEMDNSGAFGGKLWATNGRVYVSCYSEHSTPVREALIKKANERLAEFLRTSGIDLETI